MARKAGTEIRIGITDGYRYIAVKPPLNDAEIAYLNDRDTSLLLGSLEQISLETSCTMIQRSSDLGDPQANTERAVRAAERLAVSLRAIRPASEEIQVYPDPVTLQGHASTPFNPITR